MFILRLIGLLSVVAATELPVKIHTKRAVDSRIANVHVEFDPDFDSVVSYTYGSCHSANADDYHHSIARSQHIDHDRLVWRVPGDAQSGDCISAWDDASRLVGRSSPISVRNKWVKRTVIPMDNSSGIDAEGPWFDGVALLSGTNLTAVEVAQAKAKEIAIVGAGMAGLMTWLCLHQSGMQNLQLIESSGRLGGRVRTRYFGDPSERLYQEMGPMRFPKSITDRETNRTLEIQDQKLVFGLADELNRLNGNRSEYSVDFIPFIQRSTNGLRCTRRFRLANGRCPTNGEAAANASLSPPEQVLAADVEAISDQMADLTSNPDLIEDIATNVFQAHKDWLDSGLAGQPGDSWSEFAYVHNYLGASLNVTEQVLNNALSGAGNGEYGFWLGIFEGTYFRATDWRTVDGGLNRLPNAFHPLVDDVTRFNRRVSRISYDEESKRVSLYWRDNYTQPIQSTSYDYAITTVPFTVMRMWELPDFSRIKISAIRNYQYVVACKVALVFQTRFWEHFERPIYGSCASSTDRPGIGSICYPSYDINSTGPGVMLASYTTRTDDALRWISVPEEEHVQYVVDAMADAHGDVVYEQYTGEYDRQCWILDENSPVGWAAPSVGQRQLYIPLFFQTEQGVILSGEATSYTSSWRFTVASALESGIRASVQLLLELGLVDEAQAIVEKWMARWISV